MDNDAEEFSFPDNPDWSLEPREKEIDVWVEENERMVALQCGDDDPMYLSPVRARKIATQLKKGANNTDLQQKTRREVNQIRRAADRAEGAIVRLKVPYYRVKQARGNLEPGFYMVSQEEARFIIRGMVTEMARERLDDEEGTAPRGQVLEEAADVLSNIKEDITELSR